MNDFSTLRNTLRATTLPAAALLALAPVLYCGAAQAQESQPLTLHLKVEDSAEKSGQPASPKYTAPLLDTPQTITVVSEQVIKEQNLMSLRDILSTVPGITFGAGEGGGGYGDSVTLRGYNANSDITQDGLRNSAQYTRSDSFNMEQLEVVNGSNSVYSGSGSLGGSINLVSKAPQDTNFIRASGGVGTANYYRGTVDANRLVSDTIALRLNVMGHKNDVPGRDVEFNERWGIAPSVTLGITTPTRFTLSYFHQHDNNIPQYGVGYFRNAFNNGPLAGVDTSDYFGYSNIDTQRINVDSVTGKFEHDFNDHLTISNISRWEQVDQYSLVDAPQGTWCLASGINPATGAACTPVNSFQPSGNPRGLVRDTRNTTLVNQTDFKARFETGSLAHNAVVGLSFSRETFDLDTGNVLRNPAGATPNPTLPVMTLNNPNSVWTGPINFVRSATQDGTLETAAVYAFDTINLLPQLELNAGVRYESAKGTFTSSVYGANGAFTSQTPVFKNTDVLFSYRAGLVYKPVENGSIYIAYGNSKTPSKTSVSASCTSGTFGAANFVNNCNVKPESGKSYEIGVKWVFLNERLSTTAALFRNDRSNYKVASNDPTLPDQQLDGSARVDGIALSVAGQVTRDWTVFANYTYLKTKVLQSASNFCLANPTIPTCADAIAGIGNNAAKAGNPLTQVPKHAFNLWTTYQLPYNLQVGYGVSYQGKFFLNNGAGTLYSTPSYAVHRAMVGYKVTDRLVAQVNINNLFDKTYYTRIRNNGWATVGDGRSASLTINYEF